MWVVCLSTCHSSDKSRSSSNSPLSPHSSPGNFMNFDLIDKEMSLVDIFQVISWYRQESIVWHKNLTLHSFLSHFSSREALIYQHSLTIVTMIIEIAGLPLYLCITLFIPFPQQSVEKGQCWRTVECDNQEKQMVVLVFVFGWWGQILEQKWNSGDAKENIRAVSFDL